MIKQKVLSTFHKNIFTQISLAFLIIFFLKWQVLNQPPVWDTAFGVFPAAITLNETGFDLLNLLKMPGYFEGGPNVHANSIITFITAVMIYFFGETNILFPVIHIFHFIITAIGLTFFYRFCIPIFDKKLSFLLTLTVLIYPVFLTQTGYMYLEMPTFLFSILTLSVWAKKYYGRTIIFSILATLAKESGIIVVVTVAIAAILEPISFKKRMVRCLSILAFPTILIVASKLIHPTTYKNDYGIIFRTIIYRAYDIKRYLFNTPDLFFCVILFVSILLFSFQTSYLGLKNKNLFISTDIESIALRHVSLSILFLLNFFCFYYIAVPIIQKWPMVLIRYYTLAIPFLFLTILWFWSERLKVNNQILSLLLTLLIVFFGLNRNGTFYPNAVNRFGNDFSIAERSAEYTDLLLVQKESIRYTEKIAKTHPVFYALPIHYFTKYPLMGYTTAPFDLGYCIYLDNTYLDLNLEKFPDCFYMLKISPWLGGEKIQQLFEKALSNPNYLAVRDKLFSKGNYYSEIFRIKRHNKFCGITK